MQKKWAIALFILLLGVSSIPYLEAKNSTQEMGAKGMRFPCWSPDGKWIAFSLYGDIWKVSSQGGKAIRLTLHEADDVKPRWSPDGKTIAFSSNRNGNFDVWTVSADGGCPKQVTFHSSWDSVSDWTPDGKWIIFYSYRSGELELWKIPAQGGMSIQITRDGGRDASVSYDGTKIVYCRGEASLWRKGYRGSSNWDIYSLSLTQKLPPKQLTDFPGNDLYPSYAPDGKTIYYLREQYMLKNGKKISVYNIWKMDASGANPVQITHFTTDVISPNFSRDGKKVVMEKDFRIWQMELPGGKPKIVPIFIDSDTKSDQKMTRVITSGSEMGDWSPDGEKIVFVLNGDIWLMPSYGGEAQQLTSGPEKDQWPRFSPDGKFIAYFSNKSHNNNDIYILNLKTGETKQLTKHPKDDFYHSWSPDGKYILFTSERSGNRDIWIIPSTGGTPRQLTNSPESEDDAVFSPDGKWIAFDSGKGGNQEIWIMPSNGNYAKDARQLTHQGGLTQVPSWSPDSKRIAYETNDQEGNSSIWVISYQGGESMQVVAKASLPCWSPDGKLIMFESDREGKKSLYQIEAPQKVNIARKIPFVARLKVDLQKERVKVFEEAWQEIFQGFYDPKFHGIDWVKIKKKYKPLIYEVKTDLEFNVLINRMLGELMASHTGISSNLRENKVNTGYIGWTLERVPGKRAYRVKEILRDGPADKVWIRKGDYVFQIAGKLISPDLNIAKLLNNQVGKEVRIFISPSLNPQEGRYVTVKPVNQNEIDKIKYHHWIMRNIKLVRQGTQCKVVYIHLPEMNIQNLRKFREIVRQTVQRAEGMILDIRNNVGGNIHQMLLDILTKRPFVAYQARNQKRSYQPMLYWDKPVVLLINEKSFSDAEVFAYAFKYLKLGYVVGTPTSGGVIGTRDITLSNQANFRVPRVGYYGLDGTNLEGLGVKPDYLVTETPKDRLENRDPQLLKAIQVILREIQKNRKKSRKSPPVSSSPNKKPKS